MAWRIDEQVIKGEIDNTERGRVRGKIWLHGMKEPVVLDLEGNAWRDLAGTRLTFINPDPPKPRDLDGFFTDQMGTTGDITASRKVRVPDISMEELMERYERKESFPWHWGNSLYLEWFSLRNGRVVIESANYELVISPDRSWEMTEAEEEEQRIANGRAMEGFMDRMAELVAKEEGAEPDEDDDQDPPLSEVERKADEEAARMDLLMDRITARLDKEEENGGDPAEAFERIMEEERERLRKERGEPEPEPLTPEEEQERQAWIEEANAAAEEAEQEMEAERWKGEDSLRERDLSSEALAKEGHPLQKAAHELTVRLHHEIKDNQWLKESDPQEHPLREIGTGTMIASAKMAGALNRFEDEPDDWPPDELSAGDILVRLKKAREALKDALAGLDAADEQQLATAEWRSSTRAAIRSILSGVEQLIAEVRESLEGSG
jgi:hypothetical protein